MDENKRYKVNIAIPTINCFPYIYNTLERIKKDAVTLSEMYDVEIVIGLNGTNDHGKSENEINKFIRENKKEKFIVTLLIFKESGKNITINKLVEYSKKTNSDIIHFLDDDVKFKPGSLLLNLKVLTNNQENTDSPVLVGSNFYAIPKKLSYYLKQNTGIMKAFASYFWHCVFRVAFESESDSPLFCSGQSMAMFVNKIPVIPADDKGIMDDAFLSNYAYINGKVIKPGNSRVFFNVAESLKEWQRQQTRIHLGVLKAMYAFIEDKEKVEFLDNWAYSHVKKWRVKPIRMSLKRRFFYMIYLYVSNKMALNAEKESSNLLYSDWATSHSSKIFIDT